ncbi:MAG: HAD family acid phosphatase [Roseibacillus sp.]
MKGLLLLSCLAALACAPTSHEPDNLSALKKEVTEYSESPLYHKDLDNAIRGAETFLRARKAQGGEKLTVIFDIDETTLSNLPHMKETDWGYQPDVWDAWVATAEGEAIEPLRKIYQVAIELGMKVIFLTGRTEADRTPTARNLSKEGMGTYERLILRPRKGTVPYQDAVIFKTNIRQNLTKEGYTIVANFGDQTSDLEGGYSERIYKLPNPFYRID